MKVCLVTKQKASCRTIIYKNLVYEQEIKFQRIHNKH